MSLHEGQPGPGHPGQHGPSSVALGAGGLEGHQETMGAEKVSFLPVPCGISCQVQGWCQLRANTQAGLVAINDKWGSGGITSSSTSSGLVPTAVFGGWTG